MGKFVSTPGADADEIRSLLATYCWHMDRGEFDELAALFEPVGTLPDDERAPLTETADTVAAWHRRICILHDDGTPRTKHVCTNEIIEFEDDGERATVRSYYLVEQQLDDFPLQPILAGRYEDELARVDGRWRFRTRRQSIDLRGDFSRHRRMIIG
jgi:hypothetical protein